jgi:hypothetical protein
MAEIAPAYVSVLEIGAVLETLGDVAPNVMNPFVLILHVL